MVPRIGSPPAETAIAWGVLGEHASPPSSLVVTRLGTGDKRGLEVECQAILCPGDSPASPVKRKREHVEACAVTPSDAESSPAPAVPAHAPTPKPKPVFYTLENAWTIFPDFANDAFHKAQRRADPPVFVLSATNGSTRIVCGPDWRDASYIAERIYAGFNSIQRSAHALSVALEPRANSRPARDLHELIAHASDEAARAAAARGPPTECDLAQAFRPHGCDLIFTHRHFKYLDPPQPEKAVDGDDPGLGLVQIAAIATVRSEARQLRASKIKVEVTDMLVDPLNSRQSPQTTVFVHAAYFMPSAEGHGTSPRRCAVCLFNSPMEITVPTTNCQYTEPAHAPPPNHACGFVFCPRCMYAYERR